MKIKTFLFIVLVLYFIKDSLNAQVNARMFRYPDVSKTQITFSYAGDIWIVSKNGGTAHKLSSPKGEESFPKFSPDGSKIAFTGNYDGNSDVYVIPSMGGIPRRLTYHGSNDRILDWHPDGNKVLFASTRKSGKQRFNQFYTINVSGGLAEKLPMEHAEFGTYSPDGKSIAYTDRTRVYRTWKRYRGGWAPDIWLFNLNDFASINITKNIANDEFPMWNGDKIYFLSDNGPNLKYNLWVYDTTTKKLKQLTEFKDFDIHHPSLGADDIVFEAGGKLYLFDLKTEQHEMVKIDVVTDQLLLIPKMVKVKDFIQHMNISPDGKRVVVEARGELFSVPAEKGYIKNLSNTSGSAERYPAWAPDGKKMAFWSDKSGEYELTLLDLENATERKLSVYGPGFRYNLFWSPDSKKLAFVDQTMNIVIFDITSNQSVNIDKGKWMYQGGLENFKCSWSADSRWMSYSRGLANRNSAIFLYDTNLKKRHQVTNDYYTNTSPVFDPGGKYLYVLTSRNFQPNYSDFDNSFIYPNSTQLAAITLRKDVPSPLEAENDDVKIEKEEEKGKKDEKGKKAKKEDDNSEKVEPVEIDIEGFEERMVLLSPKAGNYNNLQAVSGKIIYHNFPNTGSTDKKKPVKYYDLKEREEKIIIEDADYYRLSANGEKLLIVSKKSASVIDVKEKQKLDKKLKLDDLAMKVDPKAEWKQIFTDAWRLERDYFYDKKMHGVDWNAMKLQYGKLIDDAVTRWDVNFVLGELIGEINASHTYKGGGDNERAKRLNVGYLGVDWEISNGYYRIKKIIKAAKWDVKARSPLAQPGVDIKQSDYILSVNGVALDVSKEAYHAFQGLGGKTVELLVNSTPSKVGAKKVIIKTLASETRLRHLAWIEAKRKRVDEATGGKIGYIYVRSTGIDGQNELVRQFSGQWNKQGLIIDERYNNGGQIPDRFIELLNRKPIAYWAVRDGEEWQWPPIANFGPKIMLINGWSGSGGDAFPDYFRKAGLGPLLGTKTWGGLIGLTGVPQLIDGGGVTVPTFRMYDPDGKWFKEGHGVDPDIEVIENQTELAKGIDNQLEKAIEWINEQLKKNPYKKPVHEPYEKR
ncbi:MAG: PDZ domain-containing protein [Bacteroidota bacterium]